MSGTIVARVLHDGLGLSAEAEPIAREASEAAKRVLGPEHPNALWFSVLFALILHEGWERSGEAEAIARVAWNAQKRVLGPEHPNTLSGAMVVARILHEGLGLSAEAEPIAREAWEIEKRLVGRLHMKLLLDAHLASMMAAVGREKDGAALALDAHEKLRAEYGERNRRTLTACACLADCLILVSPGRETLNRISADLETAEAYLGHSHFVTRRLKAIYTRALS